MTDDKPGLDDLTRAAEVVAAQSELMDAVSGLAGVRTFGTWCADQGIDMPQPLGAIQGSIIGCLCASHSTEVVKEFLCRFVDLVAVAKPAATEME